MILNYSNYGTRQETINLYYQGGCQNSSLFFMWGFAHGILEVLNLHFQESFHISKAMSALTQAAVYGAYFLMALPAG